MVYTGTGPVYGANPLNRAITYDADNMPTRIVHANGATVDFVYDGAGKRTKKEAQGTSIKL